MAISTGCAVFHVSVTHSQFIRVQETEKSLVQSEYCLRGNGRFCSVTAIDLSLQLFLTVVVQKLYLSHSVVGRAEMFGKWDMDYLLPF